jgi:hypothetical protein
MYYTFSPAITANNIRIEIICLDETCKTLRKSSDLSIFSVKFHLGSDLFLVNNVNVVAGMRLILFL